MIAVALYEITFDSFEGAVDFVPSLFVLDVPDTVRDESLKRLIRRNGFYLPEEIEIPCGRKILHIWFYDDIEKFSNEVKHAWETGYDHFHKFVVLKTDYDDLFDY